MPNTPERGVPISDPENAELQGMSGQIEDDEQKIDDALKAQAEIKFGEVVEGQIKAGDKIQIKFKNGPIYQGGVIDFAAIQPENPLGETLYTMSVYTDTTKDKKWKRFNIDVKEVITGQVEIKKL